MPREKIDLVGPGIKVHSVIRHGAVYIHAEYVGPVACPRCNSEQLRTKDRIVRRLRHESIGTKNTWLHLTVRKYQCRECGLVFEARQKFSQIILVILGSGKILCKIPLVDDDYAAFIFFGDEFGQLLIDL